MLTDRAAGRTRGNAASGARSVPDWAAMLVGWPLLCGVVLGAKYLFSGGRDFSVFVTDYIFVTAYIPLMLGLPAFLIFMWLFCRSILKLMNRPGSEYAIEVTLITGAAMLVPGVVGFLAKTLGSSVFLVFRYHTHKTALTDVEWDKIFGKRF